MDMDKKFEILAKDIRNSNDCPCCPLSIGNGCYFDFANTKCYECDGCSAEEIKLFYKNAQKLIQALENIKEPILDDIEKEYLTNFLRPYVKGFKITIKKSYEVAGKEYLTICFTPKPNTPEKDYEVMCLPYFKANTMYKGMERKKLYTLGELGLKF